jgi:hypothetical protein
MKFKKDSKAGAADKQLTAYRRLATPWPTKRR